VLSVDRMGELVGSEIEVEMQNGKSYTGTLVRAPVIDKVFFASIQEADGNIVNVNTAFMEAFRVTNFAKPKVTDVREKLPCKGNKDIQKCTFPAQNFEAYCAGCPGKQKRVDPLKLEESAKAAVNPEDEEVDEEDEEGEI